MTPADLLQFAVTNARREFTPDPVPMALRDIDLAIGILTGAFLQAETREQVLDLNRALAPMVGHLSDLLKAMAVKRQAVGAW